jgi:hypothetical protein
VSPVRYELGFYISEDDILHSQRRESLESYIIHACKYTIYLRMPRKLMRYRNFMDKACTYEMFSVAFLLLAPTQ